MVEIGTRITIDLSQDPHSIFNTKKLGMGLGTRLKNYYGLFHIIRKYPH